jgi:hypothetical protein
MLVQTKGAYVLVNLILDLSSDIEVTQFANTLSNVRPKDSTCPYSSYGRVLRVYKKILKCKSAAKYIEHMVRKTQSWEL